MHVKYEETVNGSWIFKVYVVGHRKPVVHSLPYKTLEMAWDGYYALESDMVMASREDSAYEPGYLYKAQPQRFPDPSRRKRLSRKQKRRARKVGLLLGMPAEDRQRSILNVRTGLKVPF